MKHAKSSCWHGKCPSSFFLSAYVNKHHIENLTTTNNYRTVETSLPKPPKQLWQTFSSKVAARWFIFKQVVKLQILIWAVDPAELFLQLCVVVKMCHLCSLSSNDSTVLGWKDLEAGALLRLRRRRVGGTFRERQNEKAAGEAHKFPVSPRARFFSDVGVSESCHFCPRADIRTCARSPSDTGVK